MGPAPPEIGGQPVVCYTLIDERHRSTGRCRHLGPAGEIGPTAGLAVCGRPGEPVYLFLCDGNWRPIADTWHVTVEEARRQAEFEFEGVSGTWQHHG